MNIFETKGIVVQFGEYVVNRIQENFHEMVLDYISVFPILIGVSFGVYALLQMMNKSLAKTGTILVFVYGALVVVG